MINRVAAFTFAVLVSSAASASASEPERRFIVPANDGYGLADCFENGAACGKIVADAWCEAKGFNAASSFGRADASEVTATVSVSSRNRGPLYMVTCTR